jgi:hypothetical protein
MRLSVRLADLDGDRNVLIDLMLRYLTRMSDGPRYDWLYRQNPDGPAQLWVLTDEDARTIVGSGGIVPRKMYVRGEEKLGGVLVDFWIHPSLRSLGPALQLQRACLAGIAAGPYALYYDFPKQPMVAVYRRLGVETTQWIVRLTKLLSLEGRLARVKRIPLLGSSLIAGANLILNFPRVGKSNRGECTVSEQTEECGEEFTQLARQVSSGYGVCVARTATYLNWRFRSHFHCRYEMLAARRNGSLVGYILFLHSGETATILDLFGVEDQGVKPALVFAALEILRNRGVFGVNAPSIRSHACTTLLRKLGFYPREIHPVVVSAPHGIPGETISLADQNVFFMDGDRDS